MKLSKKYIEKARLYKHFADPWENVLSFTDASLAECYLWESQGRPLETSDNGYVIGKKWLDVHISMWKEDISKGLLSPSELEEFSGLVT